MKLGRRLELGRQGVQRQVIEAYERVGCVVIRTAQSYRRGTRRNPGTVGIPDLYVFPPPPWRQVAPWSPHWRRVAPWWHECKREGGKQRPGQIEWQQRCGVCDVAYVLGGVAEALAHLRAVGLVP